MSKRWGEPTWYFFHVFAEKIVNDFYIKNKNEVDELIFSICANLPCPYCKEHAVNYLKKNKLIFVKNKEQLKMYFFNFHNDVNKSKKQKIFNIDILKKYEHVSIVNAYKFFCQEFFRTVYLSKHFSGWIRNSIRDKTQKFMIANVCHFSP